MNALSTSFILGKASSAHGANVEHNNREFFADNVDVTRIGDNITYVNEDVREVYDELFSESLDEYNRKQKQPCRRIGDYYEHIANGNREEAFYEIVVQFGDSVNCGVGTPNGELVTKMLDEYARNFEKRNPNLRVFCSTKHLDEASPHLHIDFIPFYTKPRKNGLSCGVSMKAALDEQGFTARNSKQNRLVAWEDSERDEMVRILKRYGLNREVKKNAEVHQTVAKFKESQDYKKLPALSRSNKNASAEYLQKVELEKSMYKSKCEKLESEKISPWKSFYYSSPDKQAFIQAKLDELKIPYREAENGLEAQECYVAEIRKLEKEFKPVKNPHRDKLRENLDMLIMQSWDYDDVILNLQKQGYTVKQGKYVSVKPKFGNAFIRLKSLGEDYSEQALRNRIVNRLRFEGDVDNKIQSAGNSDSLNVVTLKTIRHYTVIFKQGALPMKKLKKKKPFTWTNDVELDRLSELNKRLNAGATVTSLRNEFAGLEKSVAEKEGKVVELKEGLLFFNDIYDKAVQCFENGSTDESDLQALTKNRITPENYVRITELIAANEVDTAEVVKSLSEEQSKLREVADVVGVVEKIAAGTFVQGLVEAETDRRQSEVIPNGTKKK